MSNRDDNILGSPIQPMLLKGPGDDTSPEAFPAVGVPSSDSEQDLAYYALLRPARVIRDPVHGDIWLTDLESRLIDQPFFQRLRRIKQLALSDYIYPGAHHTRFDHSIGTLYIANRIIKHVNFNHTRRRVRTNLHDDVVGFTNKDILITRLLALLHDIAHYPFGHTLEDEGGLLKGGSGKQWADKDRYNILSKDIKSITADFLTSSSALLKEYISDIVNDSSVVNASLSFLNFNSFASSVLDPLFTLLKAEEGGEEEVVKTDYPYIADVVGNTVCADLLDYLRRDAYFTGLGMIYDDRIISHFVLAAVITGAGKEAFSKKRLALHIQKGKRPVRVDVLSYIMDLLQQRHSLAEKVYMHRVKRMFSAMLISAVSSALKDFSERATQNDPPIIDFKRSLIAYDLKSNPSPRSTDESLLLWLLSLEGDEDVTDEGKRASKLARDILNREKYYEIPLSSNKYVDEAYSKKRGIPDEYRLYIERFISDLFSYYMNIMGETHRPTVVIYPGKQMKAKIPEVKVYSDNKPDVLPFNEYLVSVSDKYISDQYKSRLQAMESGYNMLGNTLTVYIDPRSADILNIQEDIDKYIDGISALIVRLLDTSNSYASRHIDGLRKNIYAMRPEDMSARHKQEYRDAIYGTAASTPHSRPRLHPALVSLYNLIGEA